jgi:aminoglycoside 2'-N-acetyltransferase I
LTATGPGTVIEIVRSAELRPERLAALRRLWTEAFGDGFTNEDAEHAMGGTHAFLLGDDDALIAHASVVPREIMVDTVRFAGGYVEGVATVPERDGRGHGSAVMAAIQELLRTAYEVGVLSTGRVSFYERLGWERWQGPTFVIDADGSRRRTSDEDGGIMVLRYGPSAAIDLTRPIACHDRPGDAW